MISGYFGASYWCPNDVDEMVRNQVAPIREAICNEVNGIKLKEK